MRYVVLLLTLAALLVPAAALHAPSPTLAAGPQAVSAQARPAVPVATPAAAAPQKWQDTTTGMEFVWVPGGTFQMGCGSWTDMCFGDEQPEHTVRLDGFWLGIFPVTQGQWRKVMGSNPSNFRKGENYPVEMVSWDDAKRFITRLNGLGAAKFRLPTEAEWEYAARSGGKQEKYAGSNTVDGVAWYDLNSLRSTRPVGTKAPNGLGLYDMSGNVWQWCEDVFARYPSTPQENPVVTSGWTHRVFRGGSWVDVPKYVRTTFRCYAMPGYRDFRLGLRLVRSN